MLRFILSRFITGAFAFMAILWLGLWIIRQIPGSHAELAAWEAEAEQSTPAGQEAPLPGFYWSIGSIFSKSRGPFLQWNGTGNSFHLWACRYAKMDFGNSLVDGLPVKEKFRRALPWSMALQLPAIALLLLLSVWLALEAVMRSGSWSMAIADRLLTGLYAVPGFWLATVLLLLFANAECLQILPTGMHGAPSPNPYRLWWVAPQYYLLPLLCLVLPSLAYLQRLVRNGLLEHLQKPHWKRALSTGLPIRTALLMEALPAALPPLVTWMAGVLPALVSGSVIIEQIFSIPGLGRLLYQSIAVRDWPMVQFLFFLGSALTVLGFMCSDLLLRWLDPRLKQTA
ncbi:MAG: ABC transporter permease [Saprospiraceae bacterium]|nr:ABC transporter permease [Saprospiraceae bacterium]